MKELLFLKEMEGKIDELFKEMEPDFGYFSLARHETLIVNLLKDAMEDEEDWIGYFVYELDCGKDYSKGCVTIHGKAVKLETVDDLYKLLVRRQLRNKEKNGKMELNNKKKQ
jgi:hypothetical protein